MPIPEILPTRLAELLAGPPESRPALLDVRFPDEHAWVALPDSVLIPLPELDERADELEALRGRPVVVYCHHGVRSLDGTAYLLSKGLEAVSLKGGIDLYSRQVDPTLPRY
ncbi:rhodanese-like domain-containing protein [Pyxidicoccus caerfyrddinensis]|jgi:rhodanese-related sulfurtransferase|uniref:rhodanese-like domain-containing protein n=1 Tax=Pyxidicoccus caerfyrddinensis TaxID=2709663 RepID=UPI0013DA03A8|nr:rhodanese-like domain-containing protein [Pyxidicoccus caerfyrddinensis]